MSDAAGDEAPPGMHRAGDPALQEGIARAQRLVAEFNRAHGSDPAAAEAALTALLGSVGAGAVVRGPIACDLGRNLSIGDRTFVNSGLTALDIAPIEIGADCRIGPRVSLLTPLHPTDPGPRLRGWEGAEPIAIGDNVWIGGGATVLPGVTVGDGAVIGAGSVVTRDVPPGEVAVGNPARAIRAAGEEGRPGAVTCLVTCPPADAERIGRALVAAGLAACVNVIDRVRSIYRWQGGIETDDEALLVLKTTTAAVPELDARLAEIHPYDVHELICLPVEAGSRDYLSWVADSVG